MQVSIDAELPGLERSLAEFLPAGIEMHGLHLNSQEMRAALRAPLVGDCTLTARVQSGPGRLSLYAFDLQGAGLAKGMALSTLRRKIAELDVARGNWRAWGESDGDRLQLSWATS